MSDIHPTVPDCFCLMDEHGVLDNIWEHSLVVGRVARAIVEGFAEKGNNADNKLDMNLIICGSLLHDVAKAQCLDGKCRHAVRGAEICLENGYESAAEIVAEHVVLAEFSPERYAKGQFLEKEIVYYADKRVLHDKIVTLDERLQYIVEKYAKDDPDKQKLIEENFQRCLQLEKYIFTFLDYTTEELVDKISMRSFL